jgi:hypothetical protein
VPISCTCTNDAEAIAQGYGHCDANGTCAQGPNPAGSCGGAVPSGGLPECGAGSVGLILDGAFTGECRPIAQCDVVPECGQHSEGTDEGDCLARNDCSAVYVGINCTNPNNGQSCIPGSGGGPCTCTDFRFDECLTGGGG